MKCYKSMPFKGRQLSQIPGYCCSDITMNGLFYLELVGFTVPLYYFEAPQGLVPWPEDDIVGISPPNTTAAKTFMAQNKLKNEDLPNFLFDESLVGKTYDDYGDKQIPWVALVREFKPGWLWSSAVITGCPGESIVNVPVNLRLIDGQNLLKVAEMAESLGLASKKALLSEAQENGVEYSIDFDQFNNPVEQIAEMISDNPDEISDEIKKEKRKHYRNLKAFLKSRS